MGVAGAWTDFHVDFAGTSVWYHVVKASPQAHANTHTHAHAHAHTHAHTLLLASNVSVGADILLWLRLTKPPAGALPQGQKVFYFVEPTKDTLRAYEEWSSSAKQSETFFGDRVEKCYRCILNEGETVLIPSGKPPLCGLVGVMSTCCQTPR